MKRSLATLGVLALLGSAPAAAQEYELTRRQFPFFDNSLTIEVVAEGAGRLQVVRGQRGRVEVAARVPGGVPAFAMGGREYDHLRLTALGGADANFVVIVPEDAHVRVKLPGRRGEPNSMRPAGTYIWGASPDAQAVSDAAPMAPPAPSGPTIAYSDERAPRTVDVPVLNTVRTVSIRFEGITFMVAGTQWMRVNPGNPDHIQIETGDDVQDLIITVPVDTRSLRLRLGGRLAMQVSGNEIRTYCDPVTKQELGYGRKWITFAPDAGKMSCR